MITSLVDFLTNLIYVTFFCQKITKPTKFNMRRIHLQSTRLIFTITFKQKIHYFIHILLALNFFHNLLPYRLCKIKNKFWTCLTNFFFFVLQVMAEYKFNIVFSSFKRKKSKIFCIAIYFQGISFFPYDTQYRNIRFFLLFCKIKVLMSLTFSLLLFIVQK